MEENFLESLEKLEKKIENELKQTEIQSEKVIEEKDLLFDKTYKCPVCDAVFKSKTIKTGKNKLLYIDTDLRAVYKSADINKYDAIVCSKCGYAALTRYFDKISYKQTKEILDKITPTFEGVDDDAEFYTYDEAIIRYRLALVNAVVKKAQNSEKAFICLKLSWLTRGKREHLDILDFDYEEQKSRLLKEEEDYTSKAYEGFMNAMSKEKFPICGMEDVKFTYLCADLARRTKDFTVASKMLSEVMVSRKAGTALKNKARDVYELLKEESKQQET